jgi:hypothetical protein
MKPNDQSKFWNMLQGTSQCAYLFGRDRLARSTGPIAANIVATEEANDDHNENGNYDGKTFDPVYPSDVRE